jgi:hypothetical protein
MTMKFRALALVLPSLLLFGCVMHLVDHMTGEDRAEEIRKDGVPSRARVIRIWDTGITVNGNPVVGMRLEVHPDDEPPFEAETRAMIGRLDIPQIQPGLYVPVKFDPHDHTRVALDIYDERR